MLRHTGSARPATRPPMPRPDKTGDMYGLLHGLHPEIVDRHAKPGEIIAHEADLTGFFLYVVDGWIALTKSLEDGETQIIDILLNGDFALIAAKGAPALPYNAEALNTVRYLTFSEEMINGPEPGAAELRSHLAASVAVTQSRTAELLLRVGQGTAEQRICYALLEFYLRLEAIGQIDSNRFHVPMTQKQLGQFTGLSNVHICRTLRRFARNGLVRTSDRTDFDILDLDAVCHMAGVDLEALRAEIVLKQPA